MSADPGRLLRRTRQLVMVITLLAGAMAGLPKPSPVAAAPSSPIYISELVASNNAGLQDEDGAFSDWLEIHNAGAAAVDLGGWSLRDSSASWTLPAVSLPAGGYLVVFASSKNRPIPGANLHTSFALGAGGEYLGLIGPDGTVVHQYAPGFPPQTPNTSYGVDANGDDRYFSVPTPGAANPVGDVLLTAGVTASPGRGFLAAPVDVALTSGTPGATIRYTTDGSVPTATRGALYTGPVTIATTTTLRAVAIAGGRAPSAVATMTYVVTASVGHQPTSVAGFPDGRPAAVDGTGATVPEDIGMDPAIVDDPAYRTELPTSLTSIPTLAVTAPVDTIFGSSGFYDQDDVEVPVSLEVLYPDDPAANAQVNTGAESHSHNRLKRSIRVNFRSQYGASVWNNDMLRRSPLNGGSATTAIKTLVLRGGNNRAWSRTFNPDRTDFTLDQLYRDTQIAMQGAGSHGTFAHLYLNGIYWGVYNIAERPDEDFAASYGTGDDADYFFVNHGGATNGDPTRWDHLLSLAGRDMAVPANYDELGRYLDLPAFADYLLLSWWFGITDWPNNNFYANLKTTAPTTPARYFAWDGEWSMDRKLGGDPHQGAWVHPDFRPGVTPTSTMGSLWKAAWANPGFRTLFAQRVALHTGPGGALTDTAVLARYDTLNAFVRSSIVAESARWGDSLETLGLPTRTRDGDWQNAVAAIRSLVNGNTARLLDALGAAGYLPTAPPPTTPPAASGLKVSRSPGRTPAVPLAADTWLPGEQVHVFLDTATPAVGVRFYLDTPATGTPFHLESTAPWDFAGGATTTTAAFPYTNALTAGSHTITAVLTRPDGSTETHAATFTVGTTPRPRPHPHPRRRPPGRPRSGCPDPPPGPRP